MQTKETHLMKYFDFEDHCFQIPLPQMFLLSPIMPTSSRDFCEHFYLSSSRVTLFHFYRFFSKWHIGPLLANEIQEFM